MKWIESSHSIELTARNIGALTDKLDAPLSARSLGSPCGTVLVRAVEDPETYRATATSAEGVITLTRAQLAELAIEGAVIAVPNRPTGRTCSRCPAGSGFIGDSSATWPNSIHACAYPRSRSSAGLSVHIHECDSAVTQAALDLGFDAEAVSMRTCQEHGVPGQVHGAPERSWWRTLCTEHDRLPEPDLRMLLWAETDE